MIKRWLKQKIEEYYPGFEFDILVPPEGKMGDYSVNLAFVLAKKNGTSPADEGNKIVGKFLADKEFSDKFGSIEFVAPGFVNLKLADDLLRDSVKDVFAMGDKFGDSDMGKGVKINLEFVSANPTGPLTVGNARAASFGDTLGNVLKKAGYEVGKEYYINDVGVQVKKLGRSVAQHLLVSYALEDQDLYKGEYVKEIANEPELKAKIRSELGDEILNMEAREGFHTVEEFNQIAKICQEYAINKLINSAKESMTKMGVIFDEWFSESKLHESGEVQKTLGILKKKGVIVEEDGATWMTYSVSGFENTVVVKSDIERSTTYVMNDIAYTRNKFERGFDKAVNIWGADHHGDVHRLKEGIRVLGYGPDRLVILLHQLVSIKEKGELQKMSKRAGKFVLLDDLLSEVGKDAIRFFFLTRDLNTHMEFDVELAKEQSKKNPVFYIQYAFARLSSIAQKAGTVPELDEALLKLFKEEEELKLLRDITKFPDLVEELAENYHVHHLAQYTLDLASDFHKFYEKHRVIVEDSSLQSARLLLSEAVRKVLAVCLGLLGLSAPEKM